MTKEDQVIEACRYGDLGAIREIVRQGVDIQLVLKRLTTTPNANDPGVKNETYITNEYIYACRGNNSWIRWKHFGDSFNFKHSQIVDYLKKQLLLEKLKKI